MNYYFQYWFPNSRNDGNAITTGQRKFTRLKARIYIVISGKIGLCRLESVESIRMISDLTETSVQESCESGEMEDISSSMRI